MRGDENIQSSPMIVGNPRSMNQGYTVDLKFLYKF